MNEVAALVAGYADVGYRTLESGVTRALPPTTRARPTLQPVEAPALPAETTAAAADDISHAVHEPRRRLDPLSGGRQAAPRGVPRDQPADAASAGHRPEPARRRHARKPALELSAALTDAVAPGSVFLPLYFDGGIVNPLIDGKDRCPYVTVRPA